MAFSVALARRARKKLEALPGCSEKKMFGGLCFLLNGNICCGIVGAELMVRVDKEKYESFLKEKHAREMDFTGRALKGMIYVSETGMAAAPGLNKWLGRASAYAGSLPAKAPKPPKLSKAAKEAASEPEPFSGFPKQTLGFLEGLDKKNDKQWFDAHREDYEQHYLTPAFAFITAVGPVLKKIRPISYVAKVNGSLFRIHRDVRFAKDKTPYKAHIDFWFWEGEKKAGASPGFFLRLGPKRLILSAGMHSFEKAPLAQYRDAVVSAKSGTALKRVLASTTKQGYTVGSPSRKKVPRGFDPDHLRAELLRHDGLHVELDIPIPKEAKQAEFIGYCRSHYKKLAKVSAWLSDHL